MKAPSMDPTEARQRLLDGNQSYVSGNLNHTTRVTDARRGELTGGQSPYAAILSCADSRVPPEHIFNAALGEIFVCRNAGNLVDETIIGSLEYAVAHTGCPVICVMGHNKCGAVGAAVAAAKDPEAHETPNVDDIVRRLMGPVLQAKAEGLSDAEWVDAAAKQNVKNTCKQMLQRSPLLAKRAAEGGCKILGGWYDLASGKVEIIYE